MAAATSTTLGTVKLANDLAGSTDANAPQLPATGTPTGSFSNPIVTVNAKGLITNITTGTGIDIFNVPYASTSVFGIIQFGSGFTVSGGIVSIPVATTSTNGIAQIGNGLLVNLGVVSIDGGVLPLIASGYQYSGAIITALVNQTSVSGAVTLNFSSSNTFQLSLVGNVTMNLPSSLIAGGTYFIVFRQDATGSRTAIFNSAFKFESGSPNTLSTTASAIDVLRVTVIDSSTLVSKLYKNFA